MNIMKKVNERKVFAKHKCNKGLVPRIYIEHNTKKENK